MIYKRFNNTVAIRLSPNEDVIKSIEEVVLKENISLATISGIGAADRAVVGLYIVGEKRYVKNTIEKELEITSLMGNVTRKDGMPYLHIHATLADINGNTYGGHLNELNISATCEIFLNIIDGDIGRIVDDYTGLNIMDF